MGAGFALLLGAAVLGCSGAEGARQSRTSLVDPEVGASREAQQAIEPVSSLPIAPLFRGDDEVEYRIPALVETDTGLLVAFAEKRFGTQPLDPDTGYIQTVYRARRSGDDGWGPERILCDMPPSDAAPAGFTCGNPTAVFDPVARRIVVLLNVNAGDVSLQAARIAMQAVAPGGRRVVLAVSEQQGDALDESLTFSDPSEPSADLTERVQPSGATWDAVGPGAGIALGDGTLVFPARGRNILRRPDGSWVRRGLLGTGAAFAEGTVVALNDGALMRNDRAGGGHLEVFRRMRSVSLEPNFSRWSPWSTDGQVLTPGHYCRPEICSASADRCPEAFSDPRPPGCTQAPAHVHAAVARLPGTQPWRLLLSNPGNSQRRWGLRLHMSFDEGSTWPMSRALVPSDETSGYSAAIATRGEEDPHVAVLYEQCPAGRCEVSFREVSLDWIRCGRTEPIYAGGNHWLGPFHAMERRAGRDWYVGRSQGQLIRIATALSTRSSDPLEVEVQTADQLFTAVASPETPGRLSVVGVEQEVQLAAVEVPECELDSRAN